MTQQDAQTIIRVRVEISHEIVGSVKREEQVALGDVSEVASAMATLLKFGFLNQAEFLKGK